MKAAKEDKEKCLADQKAIMTREREFAVAHAHSVEQVEAARKLSEMKKRWVFFLFFFLVFREFCSGGYHLLSQTPNLYNLILN